MFSSVLGELFEEEIFYAIQASERLLLIPNEVDEDLILAVGASEDGRGMVILSSKAVDQFCFQPGLELGKELEFLADELVDGLKRWLWCGEPT